jgi:hypothetical protein
MWETLPLELGLMVSDGLEPGEARQAVAVSRTFRYFFAPRGAGQTFILPYRVPEPDMATLWRIAAFLDTNALACSPSQPLPGLGQHI